MPHKFSGVELFNAAIHLDPDAFKTDDESAWLSALERAHTRLAFAESNREKLGGGGYLDAVERGIIREEKQLARAKKGERVEEYVRLDCPKDGSDSQFHQLLKAEGAHPKLLKIKYKGHLERLKKLGGVPLESPEGAPADNPYRDAVIIPREYVVRYAKLESERIRKEETEYQRKRRKRKRG